METINHVKRRNNAFHCYKTASNLSKNPMGVHRKALVSRKAAFWFAVVIVVVSAQPKAISDSCIY